MIYSSWPWVRTSNDLHMEPWPAQGALLWRNFWLSWPKHVGAQDWCRSLVLIIRFHCESSELYTVEFVRSHLATTTFSHSSLWQHISILYVHDIACIMHMLRSSLSCSCAPNESFIWRWKSEIFFFNWPTCLYQTDQNDLSTHYKYDFWGLTFWRSLGPSLIKHTC